MAAGPLHPDNLTSGRDRDVTRGHGTRSLGPSDSFDSASDIAGAPGLDGDSDSAGTGEAATIPGDVLAADGTDIDTDHIEEVPPEAAAGDREDEGKQARH